MLGNKRVAVVTDAISDQFYFPLWHKYYSTQFGAGNLFVVCFDPESAISRSKWPLGGLEVKSGFNNEERAKYISEIVSGLLRRYDFVIRVDVDEFVVPDPRFYSSLRDYMEATSRPYVTAMGYNVLHGLCESAIDIDQPILYNQRKYAYAYDALYKTCIVSSPTAWLPGFHVCNYSPKFGGLFLFHLKLADIDMQVEIGRSVANVADESQFREYHQTARDVLVARNREFFEYHKFSGFPEFVRSTYNNEFLSKINAANGMFWTGSFLPDYNLLEIPQEFAGML